MEVLDLLVPDVLLGPKILSHRLTTVGYTAEHETFVVWVCMTGEKRVIRK